MTQDSDSPKHCLTVDPEKEWAKGWGGFIYRKRGLAGTAALKLISLGILQYFVKNPWLTACGFTALGSAWVFMLLHRNHLIWCCNDKRTLHDFSHWLRDSSEHRPTDASKVASWLEAFTNKAAQHAAFHFRATLGDPSVTCAIRLAKGDAFHTVGRSDGMDPNRHKKSLPIGRNKGIVRTLMDKESQGIWIIPDIPKAASLGMWEKAPNDDMDDVKYVMAAPINAFESGSKAMLGILYICSRNRQFRPLDTVEVRAWADLLGLAYSEARATLA